MRLPRPVRSGVRILAEHYNAIVDALRQMQVTVGPGLVAQQTPNGLMIGLDKRVSDRAKQQPATGFFARVTGAALQPGNTRYSYTFEKVQRTATAWEALTGGLALTGTAFNGAEEPTVSFQYSPVRTGSIVRMFSTQTTGGETSTTFYMFYASQNADTLPETAGIPAKQLTYSVSGTLDSSTWDITVDKSMGVSVPIVTWDLAPSGIATAHVRRLNFDRTGRLMTVSAEALGTVIFTAERCP